MKCLDVNLTKCVQNLCTENYKLLMEERAKEERHMVFIIWKIQCSKDVYSLPLIYRLDATIDTIKFHQVFV